jgi:hypothetical protein
MPGSGLFNAMFTIVPVFIGIIFVVVIGSIVVNVLKGVAQWSENNAQPIATQEATVVAKRTEVTGQRERSTTRYHATFEWPGGGRQEFGVSGQQFGLLAEGDAGVLKFQGTRYLSFLRCLDQPAEPAPPAVPANLACEYCGSAIPAGTIKCVSCGWTWRPKLADPAPAERERSSFAQQIDGQT